MTHTEEGLVRATHRRRARPSATPATPSPVTHNTALPVPPSRRFSPRDPPPQVNAGAIEVARVFLGKAWAPPAHADRPPADTARAAAAAQRALRTTLFDFLRLSKALLRKTRRLLLPDKDTHTHPTAVGAHGAAGSAPLSPSASAAALQASLHAYDPDNALGLMDVDGGAKLLQRLGTSSSLFRDAAGAAAGTGAGAGAGPTAGSGSGQTALSAPSFHGGGAGSGSGSGSGSGARDLPPATEAALAGQAAAAENNALWQSEMERAYDHMLGQILPYLAGHVMGLDALRRR